MILDKQLSCSAIPPLRGKYCPSQDLCLMDAVKKYSQEEVVAVVSLLVFVVFFPFPDDFTFRTLQQERSSLLLSLSHMLCYKALR